MKLIRLGLHPAPRLRGEVFELQHLGNDALETLHMEVVDLLKRRDYARAKRAVAGEYADFGTETYCQTAAGADIALKIISKE